MKTILKHITSYLLVLLVLVATTNMSVTKMTCFLSGNVVYGLQEMEDCSFRQKEANSFQKKCCDFDKITLDYRYDTTLQETFSIINTFICSVPVVFKYGFQFSGIFQEVNYCTNTSPPQSFSGIDLLKFIQIFRL